MKIEEKHSSAQEATHKGITDAMRRRAGRSRFQAYFLLVITLAVASYAAFYFSSDIRSYVTNVNLMNANIQDVVNVTIPEKNFYDLLVEGILRLGAVFLAIYVIRLLFILVRHQINLAEDLEQRADLIELSEGDEAKIEIFASLIAIQSTEPGRIPDHPYGKFADAIKEIASKLPDK